jgi:hypothetical protein
MMLLILAAAAATPQTGELRTFRDWTVGCDNGLACEAIALLPENEDWDEWTTMSVSRGAGRGDAPTVTLQAIETQPVALIADGRPLAVRFEGHVDGYTVVADDPAAFISALQSAQRLEARGSGGATIGRISLSGATAAMLYMDEQQRRVDTITALVRPGTEPASTVPAAPTLPIVTLAPAPGDEAPIAISEVRIDALRRESACTIEEVGGPDHHEAVAIAPGTTLILLACGSGAYNVTYIPYIAEQEGDAAAIRLAPFDSQWGLEDEELGRPTLINAGWDAESRLLGEYSKGRGLGDCGRHAEYGWDGSRFRIVRQEDMEECRGSLYYITTWDTQVERP